MMEEGYVLVSGFQGVRKCECEFWVLGFVYLLITIQLSVLRERVCVRVCRLLCTVTSWRGVDQLHYA